MSLKYHNTKINTGIPEIIVAKISDPNVKLLPNLNSKVKKYKNTQASIQVKPKAIQDIDIIIELP